MIRPHADLGRTPCVARAFALEPAILLADEPTGNLDTRTSIDIMGVFQKLNDRGITIVMVTHDPHASARAAWPSDVGVVQD